MTDPLDSMPDDVLGETFAVELLKWKRIDSTQCGVIWKDREGAVVSVRHVHRFAKSADAILPFLEKVAFRFEAGKALGCQYGVVICGTGNFTEWRVGGWHRAIQPTFARAAAIALIRHARAERAQKGGA